MAPSTIRQRIGLVLLIGLALLIALAYALATPSTVEDSTTFAAQNVECILYREDSMSMMGAGHDEHIVGSEEWTCGEMEHLNDDVRFLAISTATLDSDNTTALQDFIKGEKPSTGFSKLIISDVVVDVGQAVLYIPSNAIMTINDQESQHRRLAPKTGDRKTLVVRVVASNKAPDMSLDELRETVLGNDYSVARGYKDCSHNKLRISAYKVIDLPINMALDRGRTQRHKLQNAATAKIESLYNSDDFDYIQMCLPFGSVRNEQNTELKWVGYASQNGKQAVVNDIYCSSVSIWMHEVGHNLGLGHSHAEEMDAQDTTDLMAVGWTEENGFNKQCYNAVKNWQLGWYENMKQEINPGKSFSQTYKMVGVDDYRNNENQKLISLKFGKYYIGFNSKKGINEGVRRAADELVILEEIQEGDPRGWDKDSHVLAYLGYGGSYTIPNVNGVNIAIDFDMLTKGDDWVADIRVRDASKPRTPQNEEGNDFCFKLEILSDSYPGDISWEIEEVGTGAVVKQGDDYTKAMEIETRDVCLKYDTKYKYTIFDAGGDGICCGDSDAEWATGFYGDGHYKAYYGASKTAVFQPGGVLDKPGYGDKDERIFTTPPNPSQPAPTSPPPTKSPTKPPTPKPPPPASPPPTNSPPTSSENNFCVTIEIKSDTYPEDISWSIAEVTNSRTGRVVSTQGKYDKPNAVETREVCLKHDTEYKFIIEDSTGDGICCGDSDAEWATGYYGDGYYKAYYGASNTELFPPGGVLDRSLPKGFGSREERTFTTPKAQTTGKRCRRKEKPNVDMKFKVKRQGKIRQIKRKCTFIAGMKGIAVAKSYCRKRNMNVAWEQGQKKPILADMCPETCGRLGVGKCRFLKDQ